LQQLQQQPAHHLFLPSQHIYGPNLQQQQRKTSKSINYGVSTSPTKNPKRKQNSSARAQVLTARDLPQLRHWCQKWNFIFKSRTTATIKRLISQEKKIFSNPIVKRRKKIY
jgi:hypothetical protein